MTSPGRPDRQRIVVRRFACPQPMTIAGRAPSVRLDARGELRGTALKCGSCSWCLNPAALKPKERQAHRGQVKRKLASAGRAYGRDDLPLHEVPQRPFPVERDVLLEAVEADER